MRPLPPPDQPWRDQPLEEHALSAPEAPRLTADLGDPSALADLDTQPVPAAPSRLAPADASPHAGSARRSARSGSATALADVDTQPLPGLRGVPPAKGASTNLRSANRPLRRRRAPSRWARLRASPWLARLAVALGLVVLGVRAGLASSAFMAPGGDILGWSRLPQTTCKLCHAPQPTQVPGHPLTPAEYAALLLPQLSLDDELGQMMIVQFIGLEPTPDAVQMINAQGAGGVLFFSSNIKSADQLRSMNQQLQQLASIPLLLAVDQEGGPVNRLINVVGPLPSASSLQTPAQAEARGEQDAGFLSDFGFNLDLAPVVDVGTDNPELAGRTFGSTPDRVETMAGAYLAGLQQSGAITGTLKHYPGLGDTSTDPHIGLPVLHRSRTDWENIDLAPYRGLLKTQDVRAIMVTHELIPAVDNQYPASLSPALIDGVLRGELGFNGVVITDSLYMGALNQRWSVPQAAVLAIKAGADIVIGPYNPQMVQQTMDAFKQAIADGTLTRARIDASVLRILTLKIEMGLIPLPHQSGGTPPATPSSTATTDALQVARLPEQL